jgi:hypothetical protein
MTRQDIFLHKIKLVLLGGRVRSPRPWLGCTCGSRHSFASSVWSGSGSGSGHRSLELECQLYTVGLWEVKQVPAGQKLAIRPFLAAGVSGWSLELTSHEFEGLSLAFSVRHICDCLSRY